jgi:diadenosine tetraphosphatase ApaH/serine/threonine PP2A family protein phosphatase
MPRLAILTDIHGNLEALESVLADLRAARCEAVACLGDFIGYGASPNECIDRVRPELTAAVLGNHDVAALGRLKLGGFHSDAATAARWTSEHLNDANRTWLESLPYSVSWLGVRLVHATPSEPEAWNYVLSISDALLEWDAFDERICFIGHSHVPGVFVQTGSSTHYLRPAELSLDASCRYLVNVGSCGQPRDGDPRAAYLILDQEAGTLEHRRVDYDVDAAGKRILEAGLPSFLAERLRWGE